MSMFRAVFAGLQITKLICGIEMRVMIKLDILCTEQGECPNTQQTPQLVATPFSS